MKTFTLMFLMAVPICIPGCTTPPAGGTQDVQCQKVPLLGDIPILGRLFSFEKYVPPTKAPIAPPSAGPTVSKSMPALPDHQRSTCAVLNFDTRGGVSKDEASLLSDRFAVELDKLKQYKLVNRSKMAEILKLQAFAKTDNCSATECAIEAGQLLGVQHMIYGTAGKIGETFTVNVYMVDVATGGTEKTASVDQSGKLDELLTQSMKACAESMVSNR